MKILKKQNGITLVALIVTIIVILILSVITFSMLSSNTGIMNKAVDAKKQTNLASQIEKWNSLKTENKMDLLLNENPIDENYVRSQLESVNINFTDSEWVGFVSGQEKKLDESTSIYYSDLGNTNNILTSATKISLSTGNDLVLKSGTYCISDPINIINSSIIISSGEDVILIVNSSCTIDDRNYSKSAINIQDSAKLTLYANGTMNLYSGNAASGGTSVSTTDGQGGTRGYAGIHVPATGIVNICGIKDIYVYGGDAGDGGSTVTSNTNKNGGRRWSVLEQELVEMVEMVQQDLLI